MAIVTLSFDVEEHYRIEAAAGLTVSDESKATYAHRMEASTNLILETMAEHKVKATFYVVGEIAKSHPQLVRAMVTAGHEVGSHSWDHRTVHRFTPEAFLEDAKKSKAVLEETSGQRVRGFRAPTFSIMKQTAWALDGLVTAGYDYDTSIFPVRHDRYGVPDAPRIPFWAKGPQHKILELPPTTWKILGQNLPVAGGGYFRLFPLLAMKNGINQLAGIGSPAMLYFHPWEFDPQQPQLPLKTLSRFRTYVGVGKSLNRLKSLLKMKAHTFRRACDVVDELNKNGAVKTEYKVG